MLNRRSVWLALGASLLMAWLLVACGPSATPTAEPTPTRPLRPTFTPSPAVTDTPTSPPPTPTPADTPTPAATDTPTETPTDTPEPPTPTPEPQPVAVVSGSNQVNVRSGPGTAYPVQGRVARGTELEIVGRNDAGDWWQVCCVDDQEVWIVARLVTVQGDTGSVEVAANIPPAPTRPPAPPTSTPAPAAPTPTPAPAYTFDKFENPPARTNSNPVVTFWGLLYTQDALGAVGDHKLVVQGPVSGEATCGPNVQFGDANLPSQFIYNCKAEFLGAPGGVYTVFPADLSGNQVGEAYQFTVEGELRTFFARWRKR